MLNALQHVMVLHVVDIVMETNHETGDRNSRTGLTVAKLTVIHASIYQHCFLSRLTRPVYCAGDPEH